MFDTKFQGVNSDYPLNRIFVSENIRIVYSYQ